MPGALRFIPRGILGITAVVSGEEVTTRVQPSRVSVVRKPHTHADEATIEFDGTALPFDPRHLESVVVSVLLANAESTTETISDRRFERFVGYLDDDDDDQGDRGPHVTVKARDLSADLRNQKRLPKSALPRYSDDLASAIKRVMDAVPGASDMLTVRQTQGLAGVSLGKCVSKRAAAGPVPMPSDDPSAWEAIETVAALCGRMVTVDLRELVVHEPHELFGVPGESGGGKPKYTFIFGDEDANVLSVRRHKKFIRNRKGIRVISFDPETRTRIEADWPTDRSLPPRKRPKATTAKKGSTSKTKKEVPPPERDVFTVKGLQTKDAALSVAKRIWAERACQEIEGELTSPVWDNDILDLRNGDRIQLKIKPALEAELQNIADEERAVSFLETRLLMDRDVARVFYAASWRRPSDIFYVKQVTLDWSATGRPSVKIDFINMLVL